MRNLAVFVFAVMISGLFACADDDGEQAGQACEAPTDCYPDVDVTLLQGEVQCLDRVSGGYCTHLCATDADCCAVEGECRSGLPQVCAPFESTGMMMCFLSCDTEVLAGKNEGQYCMEYAHPAFGCRSTGGGSQNRKVCVP